MKRLMAAILASSLGMTGTARAEGGSCAPQVTLEGDAALTAAVRAELALPASSLPPCPPLVVRVEANDGEEGGLRVSLIDATGRGASEVVSDAKVAAVWIRSWMGDDYADPLMIDEPPPAPPPRRRPPAPEPVRVQVRSALGLGQSDDSSRWAVLEVGACLRLGAACLGLGLRGAAQDPSELRGGATAAFSRRDLVLSATLGLPWRGTGVIVTPTIGAGAGWLRTERRDGSGLCIDTPDGGGSGLLLPCVDPDGRLFFGDGFRDSSVTLRLDAGVSLAFILGAGFALELAVSGEVRVGGSNDPITPDAAFVLEHDLVSGEIAALPPLPRYAGVVMLGLSWENGR